MDTMKIKDKNQTPLEAYNEEIAALRRFVNEINEAVEEMEAKAAEKEPRITWGDISDAARTRAQLEDVTDRIYSRGEYAHT